MKCRCGAARLRRRLSESNPTRHMDPVFTSHVLGARPDLTAMPWVGVRLALAVREGA